MPSSEDPPPPSADALGPFEALDLPAFLADPATSALVAATSSARRLLGLAATPAPLAPSGWMDRLHPEDRAALAAALQPGGPERLALRLDLDRLAYQRLHLELRRRGGGVLGLLTPLSASAPSGEPELEALLQALPFDVWERDARGVLIRQNATALRNWGTPLGTTVETMGLSAEMARQWNEMNARAFAGEVVKRQLDYALAGGTAHYINVIAPVREGGEVRGVVGVNLDITASRAVEAERDELLVQERHARSVAEAAERRSAELVARLSRSLEELDRAQAQLVQRERLAAVGELAAVVAHEVRNPLGAIFNSLSSLRRHLHLGGDAQVLFGILEEEAARLNRTVSDLLSYVRPLAPARRPQDLAELSREALALALRTHGPDRAGILAEVRAEVAAPAAVDAALVRIALTNLVVNAVQAMPDGGQLSITVAPEERGVGIAVRDSGKGISSEVLERVFEPFFTTRASGTGLGLAVVRRIAEAHQGRVAVQSAPGQGATFTLWLPA
jgi:signal transduction histidine kinase